MEIVVTFMAILELARTRIIRLLQHKIFGTIRIVKHVHVGSSRSRAEAASACELPGLADVPEDSMTTDYMATIQDDVVEKNGPEAGPDDGQQGR